MATIQIRNLDEEVHDAYARRAKQAGQSLQQYMRRFLIEHAPIQTNAEIFAEISRRAAEARKNGTATILTREDVLTALDESRAEW